MMVTSCPKCNNKSDLAPDNCVIYYFKYLAWMSYLDATCKVCGQRFEQWLAHVYEKIEAWAETTNVPLVREEAPPDEVIQQFNDNHGIELATEHELPPTLSAECDKFGALMESIPDELLMDQMESPEPPHERPNRWTE